MLLLWQAMCLTERSKYLCKYNLVLTYGLKRPRYKTNTFALAWHTCPCRPAATWAAPAQSQAPNMPYLADRVGVDAPPPPLAWGCFLLLAPSPYLLGEPGTSLTGSSAGSEAGLQRSASRHTCGAPSVKQSKDVAHAYNAFADAQPSMGNMHPKR